MHSIICKERVQISQKASDKAEEAICFKICLRTKKKENKLK